MNYEQLLKLENFADATSDPILFGKFKVVDT